MHTQQGQIKTTRFIILIPHRDTGKLIEEYREKLFAAGFSGACSFPAAAPLARVSRPLNREELKGLARNLRESIKERGGKINTLSADGEPDAQDQRHPVLNPSTRTNSPGAAAVCFTKEPEPMSIFGPVLDISEENLFPETAREKIIESLLPPVLCGALIPSRKEAGAPGTLPYAEKLLSVKAPALSFRAAALANLAIRPLASGERGYSFEWKIGPLAWLPAK